MFENTSCKTRKAQNDGIKVLKQKITSYFQQPDQSTKYFSKIRK